MSGFWRPRSGITRCGLPLVMGAILLAAGEAKATISVTDVSIQIQGDAGTGMTRPTVAQYWISYDDCVNDTILDFTVSVDEPPANLAASYCLSNASHSLTAPPPRLSWPHRSGPLPSAASACPSWRP